MQWSSNSRASISTFVGKVATAKPKGHTPSLINPRFPFCSHLPLLRGRRFTAQQAPGCSYLQVTGSLACAALEFWLYFTEDTFIYVRLMQAQLEANSFFGSQHKHSWQLSILGADCKTDCFVAGKERGVTQRMLSLQLNFSLQKAAVAFFSRSAVLRAPLALNTWCLPHLLWVSPERCCLLAAKDKADWYKWVTVPQQ